MNGSGFICSASRSFLLSLYLLVCVLSLGHNRIMSGDNWPPLLLITAINTRAHLLLRLSSLFFYLLPDPMVSERLWPRDVVYGPRLFDTLSFATSIQFFVQPLFLVFVFRSDSLSVLLMTL